jgi:hypothetical protein
MKERCGIWQPTTGIEAPCADISFRYEERDCVRVQMHFSRVKDGLQQDLELLFHGSIALRWTEEAFSMVHSAPRPLPKCQGVRWAGWTFPLLQIFDSAWLQEHAGYPAAAGRQHFLLVSMNDLVDVLARPDVSAKWIAPA